MSTSQDNGDSPVPRRELSLSPDGRFWIEVIARPEPQTPWRWLAEVSLYLHAPDVSPNEPDALGKPVRKGDTVHGCSCAQSAIEYGRVLGLRMAGHA